MTYCKQCGTDMNGARFCPNCGAPANGGMAPHTYALSSADIRAQSLAEMDKMRRHFGAKKQQYDRYDAVSREVEDRDSRTYFGWLGTGIVFTLISIWLFSNSSGPFLGRVLICFCIPALLITAFVLLRKKNQEKLDIALDKQSKLHQELTEHYEAYGYCPVGLEYTNPTILETIHNVIRSGRSNTMLDAINLLLDDMHKAEMEARATVAAKAAEETAKNTKAAAKSAKRAANYASASFWFKD